MSAQHTQGRLLTQPVETKDGPSVHIGFSDGFVWESGFIAEDARRLAACWNACEFLDTDHIERIAEVGVAAVIYTADKHQKDLAAARALLAEVLESGTIMGTASETADRHEREKRIRAFLKGGA